MYIDKYVITAPNLRVVRNGINISTHLGPHLAWALGLILYFSQNEHHTQEI